MTPEPVTLLIFGILGVVILILAYDTHRKVHSLYASLDDILAAEHESSRFR